jgi:hypothetical protein
VKIKNRLFINIQNYIKWPWRFGLFGHHNSQFASAGDVHQIACAKNILRIETILQGFDDRQAQLPNGRRQPFLPDLANTVMMGNAATACQDFVSGCCLNRIGSISILKTY